MLPCLRGGIILVPSYSEEISFEKIHISPVFDNGTSMGYEILARNFKQYEDNPKLEKYISKGKHHMKWSINDTPPMGHLDMLKKLASTYPETRQLMLDCLKKVNYDTFKSILDTLTLFDVPVRLTTDRANFMLKLIQFRHLRLLQELEK